MTRTPPWRDALTPLLGGAGEDRVDVGVRGVGDPLLRPGEAEAVAVPLGPQFERGRVGSCLGLCERESRDRLASSDERNPALGESGTAGQENRVRTEPLKGQSRLCLDTLESEGLAQQAQFERASGKEALQKPVASERLHEWPVDAAFLFGLGKGGELGPSKLPGGSHERALFLG